VFCTHVAHAVQRAGVDDGKLYLIGNDSARTQLSTDGVRVTRIEIAQADACDFAFSLQSLQVLKSGDIPDIRIILPV